VEKDQRIKELIGNTFMEISEGLISGNFGKKIKIGLTILGSEHGISNMVKGAELALEGDPNIEVVLIGPKTETNFELFEANSDEEVHKKMEELLDKKYISACITMHYNFPIGVSTVGRVVTPGIGKEMIIGTTTGTSATGRTEAMVRNAIYGIIVAKAMGKKEPTLGILNLDGARQVERSLRELDKNGYKINFAESMRADGGSVMRGNDLLLGTPDVMVTDTLTGNIMMKVFSSYTTGGSYEAAGYGYGPGIGEGYERSIFIISRASGAPVIGNAIKFAATLTRGNVFEVAKQEFELVKKADFCKIIEELSLKEKPSACENSEEIICPEKEIVTETISGIDIMDLEDAVRGLWKESIYAESGMGCTGPIVLISKSNLEKGEKILNQLGYISL
jgi:hypothetical protein